MNTVTITKHMGRLGNNMIYIIQAIDYCLSKNYQRLIFKKPIASNNHSINFLLKGESIDINDHQASTDPPVAEEHWGHYFYREKVGFTRRREIAQQYILPHMILQPNYSISPNSLVIHLRGGDIFCRGHYAYVQPPISFYEKIIESRSWEKVYLISEDTRNPCYNAIVEKYKASDSDFNFEIVTFSNKSPDRHGGNGWGFKMISS